MTTINNVTCLIDLTALYDSRNRDRNRKKVDYTKFTNLLLQIAGINDVNEFTDFRGFTTFSPKNTKQADFIANLKTLGLEVETFGIHEVETLDNFDVPSTAYRFDALISLRIGSVLNDDINTVIVVSNSFDLYNAMKAAHSIDEQMEFIVVYFPDHMDQRWEKALNQSKSFIRFVDLNEIYKIPSENSLTNI